MLRGRTIKMDDLEVLAVLGVGTFGRVPLVAHKTNQRAFALKAMHKARRSSR